MCTPNDVAVTAGDDAERHLGIDGYPAFQGAPEPMGHRRYRMGVPQARTV